MESSRLKATESNVAENAVVFRARMVRVQIVNISQGIWSNCLIDARKNRLL